MKGKIRNIYPGGNTPEGFYSYYNYVLPQRKAEKIFCIKGGPGVGKSTLMKKVGQYFADQGEDVDFLWCSSDPDSLDGILLRERGIAIVDGTAPHIVDPKNPGAVDVIVNLGEHWNENAVKDNRERIIRCNEMIGELFGYAYGYLKCARQQYLFMWEMLKKLITYEEMREYKNQIQLKLDGISILKRAESKTKKDNVLGRDYYSGERKRFFAGAITPGGINNNILSLVNGLEKVIVLEVPVGFRTEEMLAPVSERLTDAGFDVEEYYCPMFPQKKLEHVVCGGAGLAVISSNTYHDIASEDIDGKVIRIKIDEADKNSEDSLPYDILHNLQNGSHENLFRAVEILKEAKAHHDILEQYYAPNMNFEAVEEVRLDIIRQIEELKVSG